MSKTVFFFQLQFFEKQMTDVSYDSVVNEERKNVQLYPLEIVTNLVLLVFHFINSYDAIMMLIINLNAMQGFT